jgi:hypothetical protein
MAQKYKSSTNRPQRRQLQSPSAFDTISEGCYFVRYYAAGISRLTNMTEIDLLRTCFFVGPMSSNAERSRMDDIAHRLLTPILAPLGYRIVLPDDPLGSANIFDAIMQHIDTADLMIADLTGDNPNVYYELAIRHSLGLPYVLISQRPPRFDISQLRAVIYDDQALNDAQTVARLTQMLHARHHEVITQGDVNNPITNFYGVPLAEVSPASGLGLGYFRNFVRWTMKDIADGACEIYIEGEPRVQISKAAYDTLKLQLWIPDRITGSFQGTINSLLVNTGRLKRATIEKLPRVVGLYALPDTTEFITLVDVPTALNAMQVAIEGRYSGVRLRVQSAEYRKLEIEEIDRFKDTIQRLIDNDQENFRVQRDVEIVRWNVDEPVGTSRSSP